MVATGEWLKFKAWQGAGSVEPWLVCTAFPDANTDLKFHNFQLPPNCAGLKSLHCKSTLACFESFPVWIHGWKAGSCTIYTLCPLAHSGNSFHASVSSPVSKRTYTTLYARLNEYNLLEVSEQDNLNMKVSDAKNLWLQIISRFCDTCWLLWVQ